MINRGKKCHLACLICFVLVSLGLNCFGQSDIQPTRIQVDFKNQADDISKVFKKCSFIPLETSKECLVGRVSLIEKHDEYFFLANMTDDMLMSFNAEGEFVSNYIKFGKGPGELTDPMSFMVDQKNDEVVICSWSKKANLFFSVDGTFKKENPCKINNQGMVKLEDGSIAYYTGKPYNIIDNKPNYSFLIITDSQSNITYTGINLPTIKKSGFVLYQSFPKYKNEVYFKHPYPDTIYSINGSGAQAKYLLDFGKHQINWEKINPDPPIKVHFQISAQNKAKLLQYFFEFENWIFFDVRHGKNYYYAIYSKSTGKVELFDPKTATNSTFGTFGQVVGATETGLICIVEPLDLLYPDSSSGKPADIASNKELGLLVSKLKDADNPIIMICEFM